MTDYLREMATSDGFMPHGMCYLWEPELLWLHFTADFLTGAAYWAIPPVLIYLVVKARREFGDGPADGPAGLPYDWMFVAFGVFIVACGATHFMEVWTIWDPRYWLSGGVKAVTAVASLATAVALPPLVPRALEMIRDARDSELHQRRVEAANRELEELTERLQEADRLKTELLANVSHELRTPLTLILGPADDLSDRDDLPDDVRRELETIRRSARSLLSQVDQLLDVARLDLEGLELDPDEVDVAGMLAELAARFRPLARRRGVMVELDAPEHLECRVDEEKLERVMLNLLSNAVKFTPDGGRVAVELALEEDEPREEAFVLEVRDSGRGVPPEMREAVFERFRQADGGTTRRHGGAGLGLAIARELVELHGGTIAVDDAPEGGARFRVRIPVRTEADEDVPLSAASPEPYTAPPGDAPPGKAASGSGEEAGAATEPDAATLELARLDVEEPDGRAGHQTPDPVGERGPILLVEDDDRLRRFLARVLGRRYRVETASDGVEALERLDEVAPDLILTDVMMPRMDGEELLVRLRERPECRAVPVVVLTARAEPELATRLLGQGARDYLMKPVSVDELHARIGTLMEQVRSRRILQRELASREEDLGLLATAAADRKRRLEETLEEKAVLVQELHHRVKGNLQTVSSLLNLQIRRTEDTDAQDVLRESRGRIGAMAVLHEKLYRTDDPTRTRMDAYLRSLVRDVSQSWGARGSGSAVGTELELDPVVLGAERAVTCGLLVHELLSNAFRHAFDDGRGGTVRVALVERADGEGVRITVADDGGGLPDGVDPEAPGSLGLTLVRSLVDQLDGTLEFSRSSGTEWRIDFRLTDLPTDGRRAGR